MNRTVAHLALALAILLALPLAASASAAGAPDRFCYTWGFLNNTSQDADGLQASFRGIRSIGETYAGVWNPFGAVLSGSGYDPKADAYTLIFGGGPAYTGDTVYIGFCTAAAGVRAAPPGATPTILWRAGGTPLAEAPLFIGVRWAWNGGAGGQVQLFNDQADAVTLMSVNLLDPGAGAALALEDLTQEGVAGLPIMQELAADPIPLAAGDTTTLAFSAATAAGMRAQAPAATISPRPLILELVIASDADPGNTARLYVETSTPVSAYLPLMLK